MVRAGAGVREPYGLRTPLNLLPVVNVNRVTPATPISIPLDLRLSCREYSGMSNRRYIIFSVAIVVLLAAGFLMAFRFAESKSIINVLNKHAQLLKALTQNSAGGTPPQKKFDTHKYLNELTQIDTSFCPKKFESAWLGYIQAAQHVSDKNPIRDELIVEMIGVANKSHSHSLETVPTNPSEPKDEVERAWQNVERLALEYDVRIIHQS